MNPLNPTTSLLSKLGSIAIHAEEMMSLTRHSYDKAALSSLLSDKEVVEWMQAMDKMAMIPKKRTIEDVKAYMDKKRRK